MKLLLDTHVVLWWLDDPALISEEARLVIADRRNDVFVSAAVAWEIAIKRALGKLQSPADFGSAVAACGFQPLPITFAHALASGVLPPHHRVPFDRMLVVQAALERCILVSRDKDLRRYEISLIVA
jgi:PIN domain nuclease of toxin-antitoxin system